VSDLPPPRQPYRTVALFHAGLAALILLIAGLTGGDLVKALAIAAGYFAAATAWSWWRFRQRANTARRPEARETEGR
jgi:hypothetical protein